DALAGERARERPGVGEAVVDTHHETRVGISVPDASGLSGERAAAASSPESTLNGWWHAARCPLGYAVSCGSTTRQRSVARGQRGWKRQPDGGLIGFGGSPRTGAARVPRRARSGIGIASSSAAVYGWIGRRYSSSPGDNSTIFPRYMTAIRSETCL